MNILLNATVIFLLLLTLISCESHEQKPDDAFDLVKEEKILSNQNYIFSKEKDNELVKKVQIKQVVNKDEFTLFKIEIEKKIIANERLIKEIKNFPNANLNLNRKLSSIEKDNNDLKKEIEIFYEEVKAKIESFKSSINTNVDEIGIELKTLSINNKKQ